MITPLRYDSGKLTTIRTGTAYGTTITKFDILEWASGYLQRTTGTGTNLRYMAMEDLITAASGAGVVHKDILVLRLDGVECEADTNSTASLAMRGTSRDMTGAATINEATGATGIKAFEITEFINTGKVRGYFSPKYNLL